MFCVVGLNSQGALALCGRASHALFPTHRFFFDAVVVVGRLLPLPPQDYLAREWDARSAYRAEVNDWYAFLYENQRPVEALIDRANELAERHKLVAVRPLAATPLVLKLRDEEVALEKQARAKKRRVV